LLPTLAAHAAVLSASVSPLTNTKHLIATALYCKKKGFLHLIVPPERFTLPSSGEDVLTTYTFNTGTAQHTFCRICGIHSFYRPRSHPEHFDVNVRCLDDYAIEHFQILPFDGVNWEENVHLLRDESNLSS
jgi:hypothetical protein